MPPFGHKVGQISLITTHDAEHSSVVTATSLAEMTPGACPIKGMTSRAQPRPGTPMTVETMDARDFDRSRLPGRHPTAASQRVSREPYRLAMSAGTERIEWPSIECASRSNAAAAGGSFGLMKDGDVIETDAVGDRLDLRLDDAESERWRGEWRPRATMHGSGELWKYAQGVGPAVNGAVLHQGGAAEHICDADQ